MTLVRLFFFSFIMSFMSSALAGVSLNLVPQQAFLQDVEFSGDCGYKSAPTIAFNRVTVGYAGAGSFIPSHLNLKIMDASFTDGKYTCTISGDGFSKLFGGKRIELRDGEKATSQCPLVCGNVRPDTPPPSILYGKVRLYGFEIDESGSSFPAFVEQEVQILTSFERSLQFKF